VGCQIEEPLAHEEVVATSGRPDTAANEVDATGQIEGCERCGRSRLDPPILRWIDQSGADVRSRVARRLGGCVSADASHHDERRDATRPSARTRRESEERLDR
jgi:hypothetical protein